MASTTMLLKMPATRSLFRYWQSRKVALIARLFTQCQIEANPSCRPFVRIDAMQTLQTGLTRFC
jgi:hypothetical protein